MAATQALVRREAIEVTRIASVAGRPSADGTLAPERTVAPRREASRASIASNRARSRCAPSPRAEKTEGLSVSSAEPLGGDGVVNVRLSFESGASAVLTVRERHARTIT